MTINELTYDDYFIQFNTCGSVDDNDLAKLESVECRSFKSSWSDNSNNICQNVCYNFDALVNNHLKKDNLVYIIFNDCTLSEVINMTDVYLYNINDFNGTKFKYQISSNKVGSIELRPVGE